MDFHSSEQLIRLPCLHRYHSKCISNWLLLKKVRNFGSLLCHFSKIISSKLADVVNGKVVISSSMLDSNGNCCPRIAQSVKMKWFK
ncbi:putative transcription factor C2H2 family [Helianthus anomalus]